jgi:hypothetical protein
VPDETDPPEPDRRYTQDEFNRALRDRLDRQAAKLTEKYGDYDEIKAEREQLQQRVAQVEGLTEERDKLTKRVEELEVSNVSMALRTAVQAEAVRAGARHPDDIFALLPNGAVRVEDGKPVGVAEAVRELAESKPSYFGTGTAAAGGGDGGARERSTPPRTPDMNDLIRGAAGRR